MEKFVVAQFYIKPEYINEFRTLTSELIKHTRLEVGNLSYNLYQDVEDDTHFVFNEKFKDQASFDAHTQTSHFTTFIYVVGSIDFIAIRFNHGAFRHFCDINFNELNNNFLTVQDLWKEDGDILIDQLYHAKDTTHREQFLNEFFSIQLLKHQKKNSILDQAMRTIYTNHDNTCITDISKQLMMSTRHFERKFKEEFGFTPKKFQVVSRFESTLRKLFLSTDSDYLSTVLDSGYYDQSHFIKDCKTYTNLSPTEILTHKDQSLHFYFKRME